MNFENGGCCTLGCFGSGSGRGNRCRAYVPFDGRPGVGTVVALGGSLADAES